MSKKSTRIILAIAIIVIVSITLVPIHLRRAILHGHANIDDYKIFNNSQVQNAETLPWKKDSLYNLIKLDSSQLSIFNSFGTTAFVVVHNNKIVHEEYWDGTVDTTRSNSFSVAKSIVSLLIGCLIDEGKIKNTDQLITDFLPDFKNTNGYSLRLKDLLTMSSGIEWSEGYSSLFSPTTKAYYGNHLADQMMALRVTSEPGKIFNYQSCNTQLLSMIIEKVTGKSLSEYASEKLWKPLGAGHPALWSLDRADGIEKAYCCFNSTATDFARIGEMVLDSGQFNNRQIVSKSYLKEATAPATWLKGEFGGPLDYYGYQFWMLSYKNQNVIYARGILGQYIFIIPSYHLVIVRLGTARSDEKVNNVPKDIFTYLDAAFNTIGEKLP